MVRHFSLTLRTHLIFLSIYPFHIPYPCYSSVAFIGSRYKGFRKDCPAGQLNKQEFGQIYKQFFPFGDPDDFADYVFNVFDSNKNGYIDFKEFICALSITSRGKLEEKLECESSSSFRSTSVTYPIYISIPLWSLSGAFKLYDIDQDGNITYDEMLQIVQAIYKMTGEMVRLPPDEDTPEKASVPHQLSPSHSSPIYICVDQEN